jgi:hypothetical protein
MGNFINIGASGEQLPDDATDFVARIDKRSGLMRAINPFGDKRFTWQEAMDACKGLSVAGFTDWRAATVEELFLMADRSRFNPAVDPTEYPDIETDWYWSSTVDAESPEGCAWGVNFGHGRSYLYVQSYHGRVVAVRSVSSASPGQ